MPEFDATIEYRPVQGFPGYCIGNDGSVWSRRNNGIHMGTFGPWRHLRPRKDRDGYMRIMFSVNRERSYHSVHHLVLEMFVGPRPPGLETCHKNDIRDDNRPTNLRWGTQKSNVRDRIEHGRVLTGEKHPMAKLTEDKVRQIRALYASGDTSLHLLASRFKVSKHMILLIVTRRKWKHIA